MKKTRKYRITTDKRVIAKGFSSYMEAHDWILMRDYGQFEDEGGWYITPYLG